MAASRRRDPSGSRHAAHRRLALASSTRRRSRSLNPRTLLIAAYAFDCLIGDPEWAPHPVRLFGQCIQFADENLRRPNASPQKEFASGAAFAILLPAFAAYLGHRVARRRKLFDRAATVALAASCLATHNLLAEASAVVNALEAKNLPLARTRVARIVGRDTATLNESEVSRAIIETLAESLCDGVLAPLFYLAIGGVPAALAFKAISTMDSMIGHKTERYLYFGKAAARLDDAANFLPARAGALLLCAASAIVPATQGPAASWTTWLHDRKKHASPNAGQVESAMAGALGVRLGGNNSYDGEVIATPLMGTEFRNPEIRDARRAMKLTAIASLLGFAAALAYTSICRKRDR